MKLANYLKLKNISLKEAALILKTSPVNICRWSKGIKPRPHNMAAIAAWSNGAIQPNDFYNIKSNHPNKKERPKHRVFGRPK